MKAGITFIRFTALIVSLTLYSGPAAASDAVAPAPGASAPELQERGQAILKQLVEVNRYWLRAPPPAVTNYGYRFHKLQGKPGNLSFEAIPVRVTAPSKAPQARRQGVTYYSLLQHLARNPQLAEIRALTETNGQLTLALTLLPADDKAGGAEAGTKSATKPPFHGECGNGIKGSWYGYFSYGGKEAQLLLDAAKMVPLKSVVPIPSIDESVEETFSDYTQVGPGHYVPLSIAVKNGDMQFAWKFKLHEEGLWLLDQSHYNGQKVAWLDQVAINRPLAELPEEPAPPPRKNKAASTAARLEYHTFTTNSVQVSYAGISEAYGRAINRTIAAARSNAWQQFGFDMPDLITITVTADPARRVSLWTDGEDHFFLDVRSEAGLERPERTGTFNIYGLCHETGHLAMYRLLKNCDWMKGDAKEAWAHYLGSRLTDLVYSQCGPGLWPDSYDYRADGMQRLEKGLARAEDTDPYNQALRAWKELVEITGDNGVAPLFEAWDKAKVNPLDPGVGIRQTLLARPDAERLAAWWTKAEPALVEKQERSPFPTETVAAGALAQHPVELALDDGQPAGQRSIGGSGHSVRFEAGDTNRFLTEVRMFGSRYGEPEAPKEDFQVWLCDKAFKPIAEFPFPYSSFPYADEDGKWVSLKVPPTRVPPEFVICVNFNPTATKGVYAHFDKAASGHSFTGLPGRQYRAFAEGDWLLRACLDSVKPGN